MSQRSIIEFLQKNPGKEFTSHQIAEAIGITINRTIINLQKLRKFDFIKYRNTNENNKREFIYWI